MPHTPPWLQSILEEHFEEVQMLWDLRASALRDPDYHEEDVAELDERLEAHVDGLVLGGEHSLPILSAGLGGEMPSVVFAAAYVLLRSNDETAADKVALALMKAQEEQLPGLRAALCHASIDLIAEKLEEAYRTGPPAIAATAAEVFAYHGRFRAESSRLVQFLEDADPAVRSSAWRTVFLVDS